MVFRIPGNPMRFTFVRSAQETPDGVVILLCLNADRSPLNIDVLTAVGLKPEDLVYTITHIRQKLIKEVFPDTPQKSVTWMQYLKLEGTTCTITVTMGRTATSDPDTPHPPIAWKQD